MKRFFARFERERGMLALYRQQYNDLVDEEQERFQILFGTKFAQEYHAFAREHREGGPTRDGGTVASAPALRPDGLQSRQQAVRRM